MEVKEKTESKKTVVCTDNSFAFSLTIGKAYEMLGEEDNKIFVMDDNGKKNSFYRSRFSNS